VEETVINLDLAKARFAMLPATFTIGAGCWHTGAKETLFRQLLKVWLAAGMVRLAGVKKRNQEKTYAVVRKA
jgi:hypothetical protein